jgi:transposase-like protein
MDLSVISIADRVETEADAYAFLEELRWPDGPVCPHCGSTKAYYLNPANGVTRKTRTGAGSQRRVWKCATCRKQFSVITGTIFHGTKISLRKWLFVIFEMCANKNGVAAREIERRYDLTSKSAWFMLHRLREAMRREPLAGLLSGTVVSDETYIGGKPKNMHMSRKGKYGKGARKDLPPKAVVLTLIDKATGEARSRVMNEVHADTLRAAITEQWDVPNTHLQTDGLAAYKSIGPDFASHGYVDHSSGEWVRGTISTNVAENYFSQLKRSLDGTHHHVSKKHLGRYLAEFDFRYSTCKLTDTARMNRLMGQVAGRRLTYRPIVEG